jgi:hypothetical protein
MFRSLRELLWLPASALGSGLGALAEALRGMQRAAGQGVDGAVSRVVHDLSRATPHQGDRMTDQPVSGTPPADPPAEGGRAPAGAPAAPAGWMLGPPAGVAAEEASEYRRQGVTRQLERTATFVLFSSENPDEPDVPVFAPDAPDTLIGIDLVKDMRRLDPRMNTRLSSTGAWATNHTGQVMATLHARFRAAPDDFDARPGREPPPTALDATRSQRFVVLDGRLQFPDWSESGTHGFGVGRTFPVTEGGIPKLRMGAVVQVLEGRGRLAGHGALGVVTGVITPPDRIQCCFVLRVLDPQGRLAADTELTPLQWVADPDPAAVYLVFRGEADPDNPRMVIGAPHGGVRGAHMTELLRLVTTGFDLGRSGRGVRSRTVAGPVVARLTHTTYFHVPAPPEPAAFEMQDVLFTFFDEHGRGLGTLRAPSIAGTAAVNELPDTASPALQIAGFGPLAGGTGPFLAAEGMATVNAALCVYPNAFSTFYLLRVLDPSGALRGG